MALSVAGAQPPARIQDVAVYSINGLTTNDYDLDLARRSGSDCLVRAWFKWGNAPDWRAQREFPERARQMGMLFGGGVTCSALYDHENGLTAAQVKDMVTRGPDGELVDAWDKPGLRHGSLSSPAYLDYLFRWCREQIDAGVDCLFMDENTAALGHREGYDDYSLADFHRYLFEVCPQTRRWKANDPRWQSIYKIPLDNPAVCTDGTMKTFDYRAFMRSIGALQEPLGRANPLAPLWLSFKKWRDDRAWKSLTDRIHAYGRKQGRTIWISANGLVRHVDFQVLGIWHNWLLTNGQIDLSENQIQTWRDLVVKGHELTDAATPVVLFHDWGFGTPHFPWLAVPVGQREIWLRTRAAEIYAAGGFFAFPVLGPHGCDAGRDGTIDTIARQAAFYQINKNLYLHGRFLGTLNAWSYEPALSLAIWQDDRPDTIDLHVINRLMKDGKLQPRPSVRIIAPLPSVPDRAEVISPDWNEARPVSYALWDIGLAVTVTNLDAYAVVRLHFPRAIDMGRLADPVHIRLSPSWERPARNEFAVRADGSVEDADGLNGFLQGRLHPDLANPPTFLVHWKNPGTMMVHVRSVATQGAHLDLLLDGKVQQSVDLPDKDGKNDRNANEYDKCVGLTIPAGSHKVSLENPGADWLVMDWLQFSP